MIVESVIALLMIVNNEIKDTVSSPLCQNVSKERGRSRGRSREIVSSIALSQRQIGN